MILLSQEMLQSTKIYSGQRNNKHELVCDDGFPTTTLTNFFEMHRILAKTQFVLITAA
jgi:hypothetical protein